MVNECVQWQRRDASRFTAATGLVGVRQEDAKGENLEIGQRRRQELAHLLDGGLNPRSLDFDDTERRLSLPKNRVTDAPANAPGSVGVRRAAFEGPAGTKVPSDPPLDE